MTTLFMLLAWLLFATGASLVLGRLTGRLGGEDAPECPQEPTHSLRALEEPRFDT